MSSSNISISTSSSTCYAGGVAALNDGRITTSRVLTTTVCGYYAGGLAAINKKTIMKSIADENYSGKVSGIYAGGFVAMSQGTATISNSVVGTRMVAIQGSKKMGGFAYQLESATKITNCFGYAKFEKIENVGTKNLNAIAHSSDKDTVQNSLVCNVNGLDIMTNFFGNLFNSNDKEYTITEQEAKVSKPVKFAEKGFSTQVWKTKAGQWPTLYI